jgi:hypothetical protein
MKRPHRNDDGTYHIQGKKYKELFGSRHQVWNKTAYKTTGNLTRKHLLMNKWGRIVSNKKHFTAKREKRLEKYGYYAKKGKFGYVIKMNTKKQKNRKLRRGGDDGDGKVPNDAYTLSNMTNQSTEPATNHENTNDENTNDENTNDETAPTK